MLRIVSKTVCVVVCLGISLGMLAEYTRTHELLDFLMYWESARLLLAGANPYYITGASVARPQLETVSNFNTPFVQTLVLPFATMPYDIAVVLWMLLTVACVAGSVIVVTERKLGPLRRADRLLPWLYVATLYPLIHGLIYGQVSQLVGIGYALFLVAALRKPDEMLRNVSAGVVLSLTLIKPQQLYLVHLALLVLSIRHRSFQTVLGVVAGTALLTVVPFALDPAIFSQFYELHRTSPSSGWNNATVGTVLQMVLHRTDSAAIKMAPALLAAFAVVAAMLLPISRKVSSGFDLMWLVIAPLSVVCAPYSWIHDQAVLLPGVLILLQEAKRRLPEFGARAVWVGVLCLHLIGCAMAGRFSQVHFVWYPIIISILGAIVLRSQKVADQS